VFSLGMGFVRYAGGPGDTDFKGGGVTTPASRSPVGCMGL